MPPSLHPRLVAVAICALLLTALSKKAVAQQNMASFAYFSGLVEKGEEIPISLVNKHMQLSWDDIRTATLPENPDWHRVEGREIIRLDDGQAVSVVLSFSTPVCLCWWVASFQNERLVTKRELYAGCDNPEFDRYDESYSHTIAGNVIEAHYSYTTYNGEGEEDDEHSEKYTHYFIQPNGQFVIKRNEGRYTRSLEGRDYPEVSYRLMGREDLAPYTKTQLRLMRNEVFASYGRRFRSADLDAHFRAKEWYEPKYDDVSDRLTPLEKVNVQTILEYERGLKD